MQDFITNQVQPYFNYWCYVILMMIGLWGLIAKRNLIKKLIGMSIFQTAIILLYVSVGYKAVGSDGKALESKIPIFVKEEKAADHKTGDNNNKPLKAVDEVPTSAEKPLKHDSQGAKVASKYTTEQYANPLPHVLMLTAIVVGVATLGVALAVAQSIFKDFGTLEEHELLEKIKAGDYKND